MHGRWLQLWWALLWVPHHPEMGRTLRKLMPKSFILVPGYGAQGGKGADLVDFFNEDGLGAIVNSSRGINRCL